MFRFVVPFWEEGKSRWLGWMMCGCWPQRMNGGTLTWPKSICLLLTSTCDLSWTLWQLDLDVFKCSQLDSKFKNQLGVAGSCGCSSTILSWNWNVFPFFQGYTPKIHQLKPFPFWKPGKFSDHRPSGKDIPKSTARCASGVWSLLGRQG